MSFDVGGTLIAAHPSVGRVYADTAARAGIPGLDADVLDRRFRAAWQARNGRFQYSRQAWASLVAEVFDGVHPIGQSREFFDRLYARFAGPEPWRVFPEVPGVLRMLRERGLRLAVISNWDDRLPGLLNALGLGELFEVTIVSGELGRHKPDPAIFRAALARLDLPADRVLHVGDDFDADVRGARAAGLRAAWLRRGDADSAADQLGDLAELCRG